MAILCSFGGCQEVVDLVDNFRDALLFLEDVVGELFGRQMLEVGCGVGVFAVEVAAVGEQFGGGNFPGAVVLFAVVPPLEAIGEFLELDGLGLGVVLPAFGQRLLVVPDFFGRAGAVEEEEVRRDARVGREDAVGQPDDGVEVEFLEQFFLDAGADAVAEERAVRDDDSGAYRALGGDA